MRMLSRVRLTWVLVAAVFVLATVYTIAVLSARTAGATTGDSATPALCPPSIGFGETVQCSIDAGAETDTCTFSGDPGGKVLVRMSRASGNLWPGIGVYGPDGAKLCEKGDVPTSEIPSCDLPAARSYRILAYDSFNGTYTGTYNLYLQCLTASCGPAATPTPTANATPKPSLTPLAYMPAAVKGVEGGW